MEENQQDLLTEIISESQLIQANGWKRLANFLIDYVVYYILAVGATILFFLITGNPEQRADAFNLLVLVVSLTVYVFYYALIEKLTKGRSVGKLITGTRAVNYNGTDISIGTAFKRSLSRIVPFEIFSALGSPCYPWHDKWNHTYVIDIKKSSVISPVDEIAE